MTETMNIYPIVLNTLDNWQHCLLDIRSSPTIKGMKTKQPSVIFTMLLLQKRSTTDDIVEKKKKPIRLHYTQFTIITFSRNRSLSGINQDTLKITNNPL